MSGRIQQYILDGSIENKDSEEKFETSENYLTKNPEITFFRKSYKQHGRLAVESIRHDLTGRVEWGSTVTINLQRGKADLLTKLYVELVVKKENASASSEGANTPPLAGYRIIEYVELKISNEVIDRHYGKWMELWSQLTVPEDQKAAHDNLVQGYIKNDDGDDIETPRWEKIGDRLLVPLHFWFCRNAGLALPLVALSDGAVEIIVKFVEKDDYNTNGPDIFHAQIFADHIFLSDAEEAKFEKFEIVRKYLIDQVQLPLATHDVVSLPLVNKTFTFALNHPVKELIWGLWDDNNKEWINKITSAVILIDGVKRFEERDGDYFRIVQPFQYHTSSNSLTNAYVYSFAIEPEAAEQPTGFANLSNITTVSLRLSTDINTSLQNIQLWIFALNINMFNVVSQAGSLEFAT